MANRFAHLIPNQGGSVPLEITVPVSAPSREEPKQSAPANRFAHLLPNGGNGSMLDPVIQGLTFGFGDELAGGVGGLVDLARGGSFSEGYTRTRDKARSNLESYRQESPVTATAAEVGGALATAPVFGGMNVFRAAGWLPRAGNAALTGAAYGGAYGAGAADGDIGDRAIGAGMGAATGLAVGGVASPVLDLTGAAVRGVGSRVGSALRGAVNPDAEAARRIAVARQRDAQAGAQMLTPGQERLAAQTGQPVANIDRGGETVRALGRSAANTSPEAREALARLTSDRFEAQGERVSDFIRGLVRTPANATQTREALQQAAQNSRAPYYRRAYQQGTGGIFTPEMQRLVQAPVMQRAMRQAVTSIRNKTASGRAVNPMGPSGQPSLEYWDQVQRNLRSAWNVANRQGNTELAGDIQGIRRALLDQLDQAFPEFQKARGVAASLFRADDALEAGENFVRANIPLPEARRALNRMTPEERELFREGFVSRLLDDVSRVGDRRNVVSKIWDVPQSRQKIEMVLGQQSARQLEAFMLVETIMDRARGAVQGNSTTARQLAELGLAGGAGTLMSGGLNLTDPTFWVTAALVRGGRAGQARINEQVARRVGELLASNDPAAFQRGIRVVAGNSRILDALRGAISRGVAPVAPRGQIGGPIPAAAEDNQGP